MTAKWRNASLAAVALLASVAQARDINRQRHLMGERAAGIGGAIVALGGDPVATWYNPAGVAGLERGGISLSASAYQLGVERYTDALDVTVDGDTRLRADFESRAFATFPASIVYVLPLDWGAEDPEAWRHVLALSVLTPEHDRIRGELHEPTGDFPFEMTSVHAVEDVTYWTGPTWSAQSGRLRLGASFFVLAHLTDTRESLGMRLGVADEGGMRVDDAVTAVQEISGVAVSGVAQLGAQYELSADWTAGVTVRSPTLGIWYDTVSVVKFGAGYSEDAAGQPRIDAENPGYVDRLETDAARLDFRLPLVVATGLGYSRRDRFAIGVDATLHLAQGPYERLSGAAVYPVDARGQPVADGARALVPVLPRKTRTIVNVNAGGEYQLSPGWTARAGFFTDRSTIDEAFYDQSPALRLASITLPRVDRYGLSVGLGLGHGDDDASRAAATTSATTSIGLVYVFGTGHTTQLGEFFGASPGRVHVETHTITAVIAGSAAL